MAKQIIIGQRERVTLIAKPGQELITKTTKVNVIETLLPMSAGEREMHMSQASPEYVTAVRLGHKHDPVMRSAIFGG